MSRAKAETAKRLPGLPDEPWAYRWDSEKYRAAMRENFGQIHRVPCGDTACPDCYLPEREIESVPGPDDVYELCEQCAARYKEDAALEADASLEEVKGATKELDLHRCDDREHCACPSGHLPPDPFEEYARVRDGSTAHAVVGGEVGGPDDRTACGLAIPYDDWDDGGQTEVTCPDCRAAVLGEEDAEPAQGPAAS